MSRSSSEAWSLTASAAERKSGSGPLLADSNAPISKDMRDAVYRMMKDGASNEEIVESLVGRFGEFVRYKPELDSRTFLLWATPAIAVFGGFLVVAGVVIRSRRAGPSEFLDIWLRRR